MSKKTGMGSEYVGAGQALVKLEPDQMRDYLLNAPLSRGGRLWCDRILEGVDNGERTALHLYAKAMKWVDSERDLAAAMMEALGVGMGVARQAIDTYTQHSGQTEDELVQECHRVLLEVYRRRPELLAAGPFTLKGEVSNVEEVG